MAGARDVSRRAFITGIAGLAATSRLSAADLPFVVKRVEKLYKIAGCKQPNDLQFVADGLWVLDQVDPNKAFKVRPDTVRHFSSRCVRISFIRRELPPAQWKCSM